MITPVALVKDTPDASFYADLYEMGFSGIVVLGENAREIGKQGIEAGLEISGVLDVSPAEEAEKIAASLGAWSVFSRTSEPLAFGVFGPEAASQFEAAPERPELLLWSTSEGNDPGPDQDDCLAELVEYLQEVGFEGGIGLIGSSVDRYRSLLAEVKRILDASASWWDGSEDGY